MTQLTPQILAMYLDCECKVDLPEERDHDDTPTFEKPLPLIAVNVQGFAWFAHDWYEDAVEIRHVKPILRRLKDMTESEAREMWQELYPKSMDNFDYQRAMMPLSKEGVYWEGNVSVLDSVGDIRYLLSKGFDLFGLIDAGLAIDANAKNP